MPRYEALALSDSTSVYARTDINSICVHVKDASCEPQSLPIFHYSRFPAGASTSGAPALRFRISRISCTLDLLSSSSSILLQLQHPTTTPIIIIIYSFQLQTSYHDTHHHHNHLFCSASNILPRHSPSSSSVLISFKHPSTTSTPPRPPVIAQRY